MPARGAAWRIPGGTGAVRPLTVANFSGAQTVASINPKADIVRWSGAKGLYGGVSAGATYITPDAALDDAYHHRMLTTQQILSDEVHNRRTASLREALAGTSGASYR